MTTSPEAVSDDLVSDELPGRRLRPAVAEPTARQREKLIGALQALGFAPESAEAVSRAVEDPKALIEQLKAPAELGVHGGTIRYVTTRVSNGAILPIPTNPRVAGEVAFAAGGPATGGIEVLDVAGMADAAPGLVITSQSQDRLKTDMTTAAEYVRSNNKLQGSIASQGVLLPVTLVATRFSFADGSAARDILCTIDGSSRLTACMDIWDLTPAEVLFDLADTDRFRSRLGAVRSLLDADVLTLTDEDRSRLRTRTVPAQLIVGWEMEEDGLDFPGILDAYLGLLHVEPPTPWGDAAGADSRAEAVLDELERAGRIDAEKRKYLSGHLAPAVAEAAGFDASLDGRAAQVFFEIDRRSNANVINKALRRIGMRNPDRVDRLAVATELAMRPYRRTAPEANRRNPRQALPAAMESFRPDATNWVPGQEDPNALLELALAEVGETAAASRAELAVRGAFWLTRYSCLQKSSRTDPRLANEVLKELTTKGHGLHCLHRAIIDGRAGQVPRQVREDGSLITTGAGEHPTQTDRWLRETFPPIAPESTPPTDSEGGGQGPGRGPEEPSPEDVLRDRIYSLRDEAGTVARRVDDLNTVLGEDGAPLVSQRGIPQDIVDEMSADLDRARIRLQVLGATWSSSSDRTSG